MIVVAQFNAEEKHKFVLNVGKYLADQNIALDFLATTRF